MPVSLPITAFSGLNVGPDLGVAMARSAGGLVITSRRHDPFWHGTWTTGPLDPRVSNERDDFLAWLTWAADFNMRVDVLHPRRRVPQAYTAATWPMIGDGGLIDIPDQRTLRISGMPAGLQLRRGDRLSVLQGDIIVHRWISAPVLVASEVAQNVAVTPRLPIGVLAPSATVRLRDAPLRAVIVANSWADSQAEGYGPTPITWEMTEALR